ncbi:MAG TPA: COR domain-containing protein [Thermoanaerobaculia bacterium]|nr:COR domain-containing protein [Thermoanaerobaculia bacterium]
MQENLREAERRIEKARRTQAESLDLGDLALRELPASLGDLLDLKVLYLGAYRLNEEGELEWDKDRVNPKLQDLAALAGLQRLQSLDLSYTGVADLAPLAKLQALQRLDLRDCTDVANLTPLAGLQALQRLDLRDCTGVANLTPLAGLQALQTLNLSRTGVADLALLAKLQALQSLDLSYCTGVADLAPLAKLQALQSLYLSYCTGVADLAPLAGLQALQTFNLSRTGVADLAPLAKLQALQRLDLRDCTGVADLAPLAGLQALQILNLSGTGVADLTPLAGLQGLQSLDFHSCPGAADLSPLAGLQRLQSLRLWSTGVIDLTPLAELQCLRSLDLDFCTSVADLSPLGGLQELRTLNLYGCRPAVPTMLLQLFANHPCLSDLKADEAVGVPQEVLSHRLDDNCLPRLRTYLSELDLGAEAENEVKVILLGNGRAGKTQLCRRFRDQPFDDSVESTHGVQIWRKELRIQTGGQEQVFQVNWWDFGGQDIYHGTHALFLRSRAVFLILWTPDLENRNEFSENGITLRNQPLAYWLDYVRTLAGADSPVIVVQSQCDRFADQRDPPPRPEGFRFFRGCSYSAKEDLGRETLEGQLRDAMRYLLERNGALEIGKGRAEVRRRLYDWRSEDQESAPEERQHRTLNLEEFRSLCDEAGGILSWEHALDYFHHTGVVFYRPDLFASRIVLDQNWALDAVYTVFHRGRTAPWLRDSGRFTREDLALLAWQTHSLEEQSLFLGLMESCGVCFPCGKTDQGETRYVAPDLLPRFEAIAGRLYAWKETPDTPTLRLEYQFFHQAVIRGLMSRIGRQAGDVAEYWKYGFWFKDGPRDTQLLLQFVDTSTDDGPGAGALEMKAQGREPLGLLREIRKAIFQQRIGEKPEEFLTLDGITVARSALDQGFDGRALDAQGNPVSSAAFTAFFEGREYDPDGARATGEASAIDITPVADMPGKKLPEVFISYAWGDDTPEGKIRTEAVEGLQLALNGDGFETIRDRDQIRPGERISVFIDRLTHADLVVAVISDKYLRSPYCMYEIYKLWQKHQGDGDRFVEHVVPIVLPEVRIGNFRERASYLKHWAAEAKSLEALIRDPDLSPSRESWEEIRLVREFAHHVDGILVFVQDVLMPRRLEAHLDDNFQAVREALQRRMGIGE